jgi:hypothetical protein
MLVRERVQSDENRPPETAGYGEAPPETSFEIGSALRVREMAAAAF